MNPYIGNPLSILGATVSVKLTTGESFVGEVFCYETFSSNTIVLKEQNDAHQASFRIIKIPHIVQVSALTAPPSSAASSFSFPNCSKAMLEQRERFGIAQFMEKRHTLGVRVSQSAQEIFDFIHKTHPDCCWVEGNRIKVMGVVVHPPYEAENCEGEGRTLDRIKQVLDRFNQRKKNTGSLILSGTQQGKTLASTEQATNCQLYSNGRTVPDDNLNPIRHTALRAPAPVMFGRIPYGTNEDMAESCTSSTSYPVSKIEAQPVMFLNSTPPTLSAVGDATPMVPVHQGGNGLMLVVFQNPEDCIATVGQPFFVTTPNASHVTEHTSCVPEQHPLNRIVAFPTFDTSNAMLLPTLDANGIAPTVIGSAPETSSATFPPSHESVVQPQRSLPSNRFHDNLRTSVISNGIQGSTKGSLNKCSWANVTEVDQAQGYSSKPLAKDPSVLSLNHSTNLLQSSVQHTPLNGNTADSSINAETLSENHSTSCIYQRAPANLYDSTSRQNPASGPVPTKSNSAQFSNNHLSLQISQNQQQSAVSSNKSNNSLAQGAMGDTGSISRISPNLSQQSSDASKPVLSTPDTTSYNQQANTQQSRYKKVNSAESSSLLENQTGRSSWNPSLRNQSGHVQGFMSTSGGPNTKGHHQQTLRQTSLYPGMTSEATLRGALPNDSSLQGSVSVQSSGMSSSDQHHVNQQVHYNNGTHSNYRALNGGKGNRTQRNRATNARRRDQ